MWLGQAMMILCGGVVATWFAGDIVKTFDKSFETPEQVKAEVLEKAGVSPSPVADITYTLTSECLDHGVWHRTYTAGECADQALRFIRQSPAYTPEQRAYGAKVIAAVIAEEAE